MKRKLLILLAIIITCSLSGCSYGVIDTCQRAGTIVPTTKAQKKGHKWAKQQARRQKNFKMR